MRRQARLPAARSSSVSESEDSFGCLQLFAPQSRERPEEDHIKRVKSVTFDTETDLEFNYDTETPIAKPRRLNEKVAQTRSLIHHKLKGLKIKLVRFTGNEER